MKLAVAPAFLAIVTGLAAAPPLPAAAQGSAVALASHRAVYDLKLAQSRGKRPMSAVSGRILYDFSGSPCEGYALQFRQVSQLDSGEGKVSLSDLRATTWEEGAAQAAALPFAEFPRRPSARRGRRPGRAAEKRDRRQADQAGRQVAGLRRHVVFPTEHVRRIIAAAREGKTVYEAVVYDGSESGEKLYDTLAVIGKAIAPQERTPTDAAAKKPRFRADALAGHHQLFRQEQAGRRADADLLPSPSSSTRTACRARCCSTTAISSSAAR